MLSVLVERAKQVGFIMPLIPDLVDDGLAMLQYADDTIFMFQDDLSGLKSNFLKSEVFCCG